MQGNLEKRGQYELFETTKGHQILNLNDKEFYAVVEGQRGDILVRSDSDHQKKKTVKKGNFYLADFDDDPEFNDIPHLFLQESKSQYREWILPKGTPSDSNYQKKLVRTDNKIGKDKVKYHTEGSGKKGREKKYEGTEKHARSRAEASGKSHSSASGKDALTQKTKTELYNMAKRENISGRSNMDKNELVKALSSKH